MGDDTGIDLEGVTVVVACRGLADTDPRVVRCRVAAEERGASVVVVADDDRPGGASRAVEGARRRTLGVPARLRSPLKAAVLAARRPPARVTGSLVHAHELPVLPWAGRLAAAARVPLVYDAHELYADLEPQSDGTSAAIARLERRAARRAAAVIAPSPPAAAVLAARLGRPVEVVRNTTPASPVPPRPHDGPLRVVYAGRLAADRGVFDALAAAAALEGVEVTVLSADAGPLPPGARRAAPMPREALPAALAVFDVGIIALDPRRSNHAVAAPNKLYDYLAGGLAILSPPLREVRDLAVRRGAGRMVRDGDWAAAMQALRDDRAAVEAMQRAAYAAAETLDDAHERAVLAAIWRRALGRRG